MFPKRAETLVGTSAGIRLQPENYITPSLSLADLVSGDCQSIHPGRVARRKVMWTVDHNVLALILQSLQIKDGY